MLRHLLPLFLLPALALSAAAHSLPKSQYDRTVEVRLEPSGVNVRYQLVVSEDTMQFDGLKILKDEGLKQIPATRDSFIRWYAGAKGGRIAKSLFATLDDKDVTFRLTGEVNVTNQDHNKRFEFRFRADWSPPAGAPHTFRFQDDTQYVGKDGLTPTDDVDGAVVLTVAERGLNTFADFDTVEPTRLNGKQRSELKPDEEPLRRQCSATFRLIGPVPEAPMPDTSEPTVRVQPDDRGLGERLDKQGLQALLDSNLGVGLLLVLAALFGMAHAFTPGHGKTMVAAYLVGERGTVWHAVTLGITATVAHTGSVIAIAFGLYFYYGNAAPASAQAWLMMLGGLLIFLVGLWLFLQRLRGRADHVHLFGDDHHHHHGDGHHHHHHHAPAVPPKTNFGWVRVILLGLGGGIIPCWDAVMLLMMAMAMGRIGLAIPLLFAFSIGLAVVLVGLGLAVLYAHRAGGAKFGESRWFKLLPVASALLLLVMGIWFLKDGFRMLGTTP
jgi:nickel/cobalt transporter (NicO) family protein